MRALSAHVNVRAVLYSALHGRIQDFGEGGYSDRQGRGGIPAVQPGGGGREEPSPPC